MLQGVFGFINRLIVDQAANIDKRAAKRYKKDGSSNSMDDRLSELPQPILHHILSFLTEKEAVQTCVLSKTWRFLGVTRPKIDLCGICDKCVTVKPKNRLWWNLSRKENKSCENCFGGNEKAFLSVLDKTLQRYHDQKLFTHEFRLNMFDSGPESFSLLEKWVPKLITPYFAVKTFDIRFHGRTGYGKYFDLPSSEVFRIKSLEKLFLQQCRLNKTDFVDRVLQFNRLQTISLVRVLVADETLEKIISSCPLIENVSVELCEDLQTVKLINKHPNLKHFCINFSPALDFEDCQSVEIIDAPALETIKLVSCRNLYLHNKHLRNLKSLRLSGVHLSSEFFENFSSKFPCLEKLDIFDCINHFDEFHLSSHSIKRLTIMFSEKTTKATIDAPSLVFFNIIGDFPWPSKLSFTKIPSESLVEMLFIEDPDYDVLDWFINLNELLRALGQSQITLETYFRRLPDHETVRGFNKPVVVEHLCLLLKAGYDYASPSQPEILNGLFGICRPRYADVHKWNNPVDIRFIGFLCKVLVQEREKRTYHWQQDLEDAEMEFWDPNAKEWNPTTLKEFRLRYKEKIRSIEMERLGK